jgi:hypothetical protein
MRDEKGPKHAKPAPFHNSSFIIHPFLMPALENKHASQAALAAFPFQFLAAPKPRDGGSAFRISTFRPPITDH